MPRTHRALPEGVTPEMFVQAWQTGKFLHRVAKHLGMLPTVASSYASYLRKGGVPLKKFNLRGEDDVDFVYLTKVAQAYAPKDAA